MINIIVGIVTVIAAGFLLLWILRPSFRKWVEQPTTSDSSALKSNPSLGILDKHRVSSMGYCQSGFAIRHTPYQGPF